MSSPLTSSQQRHMDRLYQTVAAQSGLDEALQQPFRRVARHRFLPVVYLPGGQAVTIDRDHPPEDVLDLIYSDSALCIQQVAGVCLSSTTQPSLMAGMMQEAGVRDGARILEIGTATGWNAALMAAVVGAQGHIYSVEVDAELAAAATRRLAAEGWADRVTVVTADGFDGLPAHAPYDAVLVTVACPEVPQAWLRQVAPGGRLVVPVALPDGSSPLLVLTHSESGWAGRFTGWTWFVAARGGRWQDWPVPLEPGRDERLKRLLAQPARVVDGPAELAGHDFGLWLLAQQTADLVTVRLADAAPRAQQAYGLLAPDGSSFAYLSGGRIHGFGDGSRSAALLGELRRWRQLGSPAVDSWRVTVGGAGPLRLVRRESTLTLTPPDH